MRCSAVLLIATSVAWVSGCGARDAKKPADKPASRTPAASTAEERTAPPADAPKAEPAAKTDEKATAAAVKKIEDLGGTLKARCVRPGDPDRP